MRPPDIRRFLERLKIRGRKITVLTAYDAPTASLISEAGADVILVGDSVGPVLLGYPTTRPVTMDEMIHHSKAVRRGAPKSFIVGDMPLKGVRGGPRYVLRSASRFLKEAGLDAVKIEWTKNAAGLTRHLVQRGIPVMGHVGLTPQSAKRREDLKVRGRTAPEALSILHAARAFEKEGAFSLVIECVPAPVAAEITRSLRIPTIGIGAGLTCDGQVLVFQDLVGLNPKFRARFVRRYARNYESGKKAVLHFLDDVRSGRYPKRANAFGMDADEYRSFERLRRRRFIR